VAKKQEGWERTISYRSQPATINRAKLAPSYSNRPMARPARRRASQRRQRARPKARRRRSADVFTARRFADR
jgi:hypothetical protein